MLIAFALSNKGQDALSVGLDLVDEEGAITGCVVKSEGAFFVASAVVNCERLYWGAPGCAHNLFYYNSSGGVESVKANNY